jgi:hypothetical protein
MISDASLLFLSSTFFGFLEHSWYWSYLRLNIISTEDRVIVDCKFTSVKTIFENSWIRSNIGLAREIFSNCHLLQQELYLLSVKYNYKISS